MIPERDEPLPDDEPTPLVADPNPGGDDNLLDLSGLDGLTAAVDLEAKTERPQIAVPDQGLDEMAAEAWRAIDAANDPPRLYRYGSALAWIADAPPRIQLLDHALMRHHLAGIAEFVGGKYWHRRNDHKLPPPALVADLLAVPHPGLPVLTRLVRAPVFAANGELVADYGYHRASGVYLAKPAMTLVRAWQAAGAPRAEHAAFGSFDPWADLMAGVLAVGEIPGLLDNRADLFATADEERAHLHAFLAAWWAAAGEARVTVATLYPLANDQHLDIAAPSEHAERGRLGRLVSSLRDRHFVVDGLRLAVRSRGAFRGSVYWRLEPIKPPAAHLLPSAGKESSAEGKSHPSPPQPPHPLSAGVLARMRERAQRLRREMADDEWANES